MTNNKGLMTASSVTHITIDAGLTLAMAIQAPAHGHIDFAFDSGGGRHIAVALFTFHLGLNVRLVREKDIGFAVEIIDPHPGRLFFALVKFREFLNLRTFSFHRDVTAHTGRNIRDCRVRGFSSVFMAEIAFELRPVFAGDVLPVNVFNRLFGCNGAICGAKDKKSQGHKDDNHKQDDFDASAHDDLESVLKNLSTATD